MTLSGHVTSSLTCPIDSPSPLSYGLSIGTIPLSGLFPRYLEPKLRQRLLRDDVIKFNGRHVGFEATGSRSIRSAVPENFGRYTTVKASTPLADGLVNYALWHCRPRFNQSLLQPLLLCICQRRTLRTKVITLT